jgi:hypothetical protein
LLQKGIRMPKKPSPKKSANEEEDSSKNSMSPNSNRPQLPHKEATINNDMNALDVILIKIEFKMSLMTTATSFYLHYILFL